MVEYLMHLGIMQQRLLTFDIPFRGFIHPRVTEIES